MTTFYGHKIVLYMNTLYPIKLHPLYKEKVWGGSRLKTLLGKNYDPLSKCGESWEISGIKESVSVVSNGFLQGNTLNELIEVYMGDLVGEGVFAKYGHQFPLLLKFIDADHPLSIQVHPDSKTAQERHQSFGKTEMWYVLHAEENAEIIVGVKPGVDKDIYLHHLRNNTLREILNVEKAMAGDVYYIPAGRIHSIGAGVTLCEIQQSSDVTYRIYDWDRPLANVSPRELHNEQAVDVINFHHEDAYKTAYQEKLNGSVQLVSCPYYTTNLLVFDHKIESDYYYIDSFVAYVCVEGSFSLVWASGREMVKLGECVLLPAEIKQVALIPETRCKVLEVYIKS